MFWDEQGMWERESDLQNLTKLTQTLVTCCYAFEMNGPQIKEEFAENVCSKPLEEIKKEVKEEHIAEEIKEEFAENFCSKPLEEIKKEVKEEHIAEEMVKKMFAITWKKENSC